MHVSNAQARLTFRRLGKIYTASSNLHSESHALLTALPDYYSQAQYWWGSNSAGKAEGYLV